MFWRLWLTIFAPALLAVAALVWVASSAYLSLLQRASEERLQLAASTVAAALADDWPAEPTETVQALIRRTSADAGVQLTVIGLDGAVLADSSSADVTAVKKLESQRHRGEFVSAVRTGSGTTRRVNPALDERFQYRAVRVDADGTPRGVVRAGVATAPLSAEAGGLVRWAGAIGLVTALVAGAFAYWAAAHRSEALAVLTAQAESLAAGRYDRRLPATAGASGEHAALASALNDLGRRLAQGERQLHSTSQTQSTVLEGMSESVIAVDRSERILFANASAGRVLGFNSKQVGGMTLLEAVRSHELRAIMQKSLRSKEHCNAELTWRGKSVRVFDVLATPLPGDPPPGVVLVLRDVSGLKHLEQMRQQFVANVSHELKTPLSSIKAYTETLLGGAKDDPVHCEKFLRRIEEQSGRLHQLIMDMLSLARIESSHAALEVTSVPVQRVVRRCLADYEPQAAARNVSLVCTAADDGLQVRADEEALRQILSNLVDNGIKYTPAGGQVVVDYRAAGSVVAIEVTDTGAGIAPEHHERLFERFYRVDKARSRELGGTGLGLSIVKHLTQAMHGTVAVASQVCAGSTFTVELPRAGV